MSEEESEDAGVPAEGGSSEEESLEVEEDEDSDDDGTEDKGDVNDDDYIEPPGKEKKSSTNPGCLFTNGIGFMSDDRSQLKTVVESAAAKKIVSDDWQSDPSMFGLIIRWAHKPSFNFAADVMNSNFVVSREIAVQSPFDLCRLRGWILTRSRSLNKGKKYHLEYKRFHACLAEAGFPPGHHALKLKGVITALYRKLETTVLPLFPTPPPIAVTQPEETTTTEQSDHPVLEGKKRKGVKSAVLSAAKKRKNVPASPQFELLYVHDPSSFYMRLTQNTKCLQIALFLIEFIFSGSKDVPITTDDEKEAVYFSMFSGCYSSRKYVELCHGLLVVFDGATPPPEKVEEVSRVIKPGSSIKLTDYISGIVSFSLAETTALHLKIDAEIESQFPTYASKKGCSARPRAKQLCIMRYVVLSLFVKYSGNSAAKPKKRAVPEPASELHQTLTDPMVVTLDSNVVAPPAPTGCAVAQGTTQKEPQVNVRPSKQPTIKVLRPTLLDELATKAPTNIGQYPLANTALANPTVAFGCNSYYDDLETRFDPAHCRIASPDELAPFAPRVYVEGDPHGTNLYCGPMEVYLLRDLKHLSHGFKCDNQGLLPSIGKPCASLEVPMVTSYVTDDAAIIRPGHVIFSKSFSKEKLNVNLPLCIKFVIEHGTSNRARDGDGSVRGTRIDFGCAGSGHEEIAHGIWRPYLLCGVDIFDKVPEEDRVQIKASLGSVYDCLQTASDEIQTFNSRKPLFNYKPRDDVYGSALRNYLGAKVMRNEWCTIQVKCLNRGDQTDRHKDSKNCVWSLYDKTGALCFMLRDSFGIIWSLKFLSNSRHAIGSYFDKLLGVETLCSRIRSHFRKLDNAYANFIDDYDGPYKPSSLSWKDPWGFFLDARCKWSDITHNGDVHRCIVLPTIVVRDFWLSAPVHIIVEMKQLGVEDNQLLELMVLGAYQTSWFRFFQVGHKMVEEGMTTDLFQTYLKLADEAFGSLAGGPKPRAVPSGLDVAAIKALYVPNNDCSVLQNVINCILSLLKWVNECEVEEFSNHDLRHQLLMTNKKIQSIKSGTELGEFRLMLILQMCALSSVHLRPSLKLNYLLYPIPDKGSATHLHDVGVKKIDYGDALRRVSHYFELEDFGDNGGESLLCETLPGRNVFDAFFPTQSIFLLNKRGRAMMKKYGTTKWIPVKTDDGSSGNDDDESSSGDDDKSSSDDDDNSSSESSESSSDDDGDSKGA